MVRLAPTRIAVDLSVSWAVTKTERDLRVFRLCVYRPYQYTNIYKILADQSQRETGFLLDQL